MRATLAAIALATLASVHADAQNVSEARFAAWAQSVDFALGTDWRSYLAIAPANFGPNGLPVLATGRGLVDTAGYGGVEVRGHRARGDRVADLGGEVRLPFGPRASLRVAYLLREWYDVDAAWARDRRAVSGAEAGSTAGDVYVDGVFQVLRDRGRWPDIALTVTVKTASGGRLEAMRNTDSPGYAFAVSFGKTYRTPAGLRVRPFASGGFYVWQRFGRRAPQNDAGTYALGVQMGRGGRVTGSAELAGYAGYLGVDDQPLVARAALRYAVAESGVVVSARAEYGLSDWPYASVGVGVGYRW